jgi:hypothetical protein
MMLSSVYEAIKDSGLDYENPAPGLQERTGISLANVAAVTE